MQLFENMNKADLCAECQEKLDPLIPENERSIIEPDERLTANDRDVKSDADVLKTATRRGWCSWGF